MTHTLVYDSEVHILTIKIEGEFRLKEAEEIFSEAAKIILAENCFLLLTDLREATMKLSVIEIYDLPKILLNRLAASEINVYKLKRAYVIAKGSQGYTFHETVMHNQGQKIKGFEDVDEARQWLLKE